MATTTLNNPNNAGSGSAKVTPQTPVQQSAMNTASQQFKPAPAGTTAMNMTGAGQGRGTLGGPTAAQMAQANKPTRSEERRVGKGV